MAKDIKFNVKVEGVDKATSDIQGLDKEVNKTNSSFDSFGEKAGKTSGLMGAFSGSLGGLKGSLGAVDAATGGFGKTLMGLLANPIVAIVAGIVAVFKLLKDALQSTEEGQNKLNKITTMLSTVFARLMDVLEPLASFIADYVIFHIELMTAAFSKAAEIISGTMRFFGFGEAADGLDEYMKKTEEAAALAAKVADERAAADLLDRENIVARAEADRQMAEAREMLMNKEKFSLEERKAAVQAAGEAQDKIAAREEVATKKRLEALKLEASLSNSNKDTLNEIAKLEADLIDIGTKRAGAARTLQRELNKISREEEKDDDEKRKKAEENLKKRVEAAKKAYDEMLNKIKESFNNELTELDDFNKKLRLKTLERFNEGKIDLDTYNLEIKKIDERGLVDRLKILEDEKFLIIGNEKIKADDKRKLILENERKITDLQLKIAGDRQKEILDKEKQAEVDRQKTLADEEKRGLEKLAGERLDLIEQYSNGEIKTKEDLDKKLADLELEAQKRRLKTLKEGSEEYLSLMGEIALKEKEISDKARADEKAAADGAFEERLNKTREIIDIIGQISSAAIGIISEISQRSFDDEMARINETSEKEMSELQRRKDAGLITEVEFNKGLEKINKKKLQDEDKAKRAQFEQNKAIKAIETIISTAAGIAAALPNIPLAVIAGFAGAAQLAMILSQQYPTSGSSGGGMSSPEFSAPAAAEPTPFIEAALPEFSGMEGAGPGGGGFGMGGGAETGITKVEVVLVESEFSAVQNKVRVLEDRSMIQ